MFWKHHKDVPFCGLLGTGHNRSNHLPGCDVCDTMEIAFGVIRFGVCVLVVVLEGVGYVWENP